MIWGKFLVIFWSFLVKFWFGWLLNDFWNEIGPIWSRYLVNFWSLWSIFGSIFDSNSTYFLFHNLRWVSLDILKTAGTKLDQFKVFGKFLIVFFGLWNEIGRMLDEDLLNFGSHSLLDLSWILVLNWLTAIEWPIESLLDFSY